MSQVKKHRILTAGLTSLLLAGCGSTYRPVVTATNPVGPAQQPTKYAVAISNPGGGQAGLVSFIDVSGDELITSPSIQVNPNYIALGNSGAIAYTINSAGTLDIFNSSSPNGLLTSNIQTTTLSPTVAPVTITPVVLRNSGDSLYIPESGSAKVAALNSSGQLTQEISVPAIPVYIVGSDNTPRLFALSGNASTTGTASAIEATGSATFAVTANIPVGTAPVYGVMTNDTQRAFVLNNASHDVTVLNVVTNGLDQGVVVGSANPAVTKTGFIGLPTVSSTGGIAVSASPVWADLATTINELVVLTGDATHRGALNIINIPLCNASTQPNNPGCSTTNPVDGVGFGTIVATVPVGNNPLQVSVLQDGSRAYVVNQTDATGLCPAGQGSVSVVNLVTTTVTATICGSADNADLSTPTVFGHPTTIAATTGKPTGKVYVTSPDSHQLTIIYTDTDSVFTHIPLFGAGVKVLVNTP